MRLQKWLSPLVHLSNNLLSLTGVVLVTTATVLWVFLLPTLLRGDMKNPYVGIPAFLLLPGVFIAGLVLIPVGIALRRARRKRQGLDNASFDTVDLTSPDLRRLFAFIAAASVANVIIAAQWGYSAVNYMESSGFCGLACHGVMQPEYTAYLNSSHARVDCVACHVGAGASWFVKAKFSGLRQVMGVALHNYPKPIPSPVQDLRPARETCERCHWPQRFSDDLFTVRTSYASDEQNQASMTVLLLKVGGRTWRGSVGIHGVHLDGNARMEYTAMDPQRQVIPRVTYTAPDGKVTVYNSTDAKVTPQELAHAPTRTMDCLDCHNRPSHLFQLPERAVDQAMAKGQISPTLPYIKREAVAALRATYPDREAAARGIAVRLADFYKTKYPHVHHHRSTDIRTTSDAVQAIYLRNVFPDMNITWGTYPSNLGHMDFPGCFRCHDGDHLSTDGRAIPNACTTCHDLPAVDEKNPKILSDLGYGKQP
jgi:hypothetical protein